MASVTPTVAMATVSRDGIGLQAFGGPTASSWREQALTRVAELEHLADAFRAGFTREWPEGEVLAERMHRHLQTAREAAEGQPKRGRWTRMRSLVGGSPLERTASNLDAAEIDLLRIAPPEFLHGQLPSLLANARAHLPIDDPRRQSIELICLDKTHARLTAIEKDAVISASRAAQSAGRREIVQIRSFRNILYVTAATLAIAVAGLVILGRSEPDLIPLCFNPGSTVVCPTDVAPVPANASETRIDQLIRGSAGPWDVALVAVVGLVAAAMAAAVSLRNVRGTTLPYSLPVALAVLKLPTGALTAVLGLLLMRGEFVPGLTALDSPGQIVAWAILFGYAQQLFTRFVDDRAHSILNGVSGQEQPRGAVPRPTEVTRVTHGPLNGANGGAPQVTTAAEPE
jgi:hypothetical protein